MKAMLVTLLICLSTLSARADLSTAKFLVFSLSPFITAADVSFAVSRTSGCTAPQCAPYAKIVQAKADAEIYIASNETIRGAQLEAAFNAIRETYPELEATDFELAVEILAL